MESESKQPSTEASAPASAAENRPVLAAGEDKAEASAKAPAEPPIHVPPPINWFFLGWVAIFTLISASIAVYFVRVRPQQVESEGLPPDKSTELVETPELPRATEMVGEIRFTRMNYPQDLAVNALVNAGDMFELKQGAHMRLTFMDGSTIEAAAIHSPGVVQMYAYQPIKGEGKLNPFNTFKFVDLEVSVKIPAGKTHQFMCVTSTNAKVEAMEGQFTISIKDDITHIESQGGELRISQLAGQSYEYVRQGQWIEVKKGALPYGPTVPKRTLPPQKTEAPDVD